MRCKVGDLAVAFGDFPFCGKAFEVVGLAPQGGEFRLPNGVMNVPAKRPDTWILKSASGPLDGLHGDRMYGSGSDRFLWPIRPKDEPTTTERALEEA